jgi:O-antigen/teichoic acid export membrane protein
VSARALAFGLSAIASVVVARLLGPGAFGEYASGSAIAGVALVFGAFGIDQLYLQGAITEGEAAIHLRRLAGGAGVFAVLVGLAWPGVDRSTRVCAALLGVALALERARQLWLLQPQRAERFATRGRREVVAATVLAVAGVGAVAFRRTSTTIAVVTVVASAAITAAAGRPWRRTMTVSWRESLSAYRRGGPFALSSSLFAIYFLVDTALVATIAGEREAGIYRAAYAFVAAALVVAAVVNNDLLRSRLYNAGRVGRSDVLVRRFLAADAIAGTTLAVGLAAAGPLLLRVAFGAPFEAATTLLSVLSLAIVPIFLSAWMTNLLIAVGDVGVVVRVQAVLAVANIVANLIVIPGHGARGAAWATVGTEITGVAIYATLLRRVPAST